MKSLLFAWDEWSIDHTAKHQVTPAEAELVIETAEAPWPQEKGDDKFVVWGPTDVGRLLQVIFVLKVPEELAFDALTIEEWAELDESDEVIYVIHAIELTPAMKRQYRKRQ